MTIGLDQQPECILYPLRGIDVLSAIKILQGFLIFTDAAIDFPTRPKCDRPWIELDRHGEVIKSASRVTELQPGKMATEVGMRIARIVCYPFVDNLKIVLRIGSQKIVRHLHLFWRRRFLHWSLFRLRPYQIYGTEHFRPGFFESRASVERFPGAAQHEEGLDGALQTRDRHERQVCEGPGSAMHRYALHRVRDT